MGIFPHIKEGAWKSLQEILVETTIYLPFWEDAREEVR